VGGAVAAVREAGQPPGLPYGKLASHRGASHWPFLGTLLRLAYLFGAAGLLGALLSVDVLGWAAWLWGWHALRWGLAGLVAADLVHIGMDAATEWV
jgi:uncharacterized metal-binding protein